MSEQLDTAASNEADRFAPLDSAETPIDKTEILPGSGASLERRAVVYLVVLIAILSASLTYAFYQSAKSMLMFSS